MLNSIQKNLIYYKAIVSYQGTYFNGWQSQKDNKSIQDSIELTLYKIFNFHQRIIGASRTDAGVHAYGQVFSFYAPAMIHKEKLHHLINNCLPDTIKINTIEVVENDFHPRFHAKKKIYQYLISQQKLSPSINFFILHYENYFDIEILKNCCSLFLGTHNFKGFSTIKKNEIKNTIKTIYDINISITNDIYIITIIGSGFLRYMIRRLIGAALYISSGKSNIHYIENILKETNNNNNNLMTLPAKGLLLKNIIYNDDQEINIENPFLRNFNFY